MKNLRIELYNPLLKEFDVPQFNQAATQVFNAFVTHWRLAQRPERLFPEFSARRLGLEEGILYRGDIYTKLYMAAHRIPIVALTLCEQDNIIQGQAVLSEGALNGAQLPPSNAIDFLSTAFLLGPINEIEE